MKKGLLFTSIAAASLLFTACGGGGGGTSSSSSSSSSTGISGDIEILTPTAFTVVAGQRKAVTLTTGENVVNGGEPVYTFSITDGDDGSVDIDADTGVLEVTAPAVGSTKSVTVTVADKANPSNVSAPHTIIFTSVDGSGITAVKPLKTGADDGGFGMDRNFTVTPGTFTVIDPKGRVWPDTSSEVDTNPLGMTYQGAMDECNRGGNWRIPTYDELLDTIDYSKPNKSAMTQDEFDIELVSSWAESAFGKLINVANNYGAIEYRDESIKLQTRCINAPKNTTDQVIYTNNIDDTYDLTTGLEWSKTSNDFYTISDGAGGTPAEDYCTALTNRNNETGWRLPNLNELRSILEHGTISNFIANGNREFISSTPFNDSNVTAKPANWGVILRENGSVLVGASYTDSGKRITCVRDID